MYRVELLQEEEEGFLHTLTVLSLSDIKQRKRRPTYYSWNELLEIKLSIMNWPHR